MGHQWPRSPALVLAWSSDWITVGCNGIPRDPMGALAAVYGTSAAPDLIANVSLG